MAAFSHLRRAAVLLTALLSLVWAAPADATPRRPTRSSPDGLSIVVPLTIHVATRYGQPVVTQRKIAASIRAANVALAPYGIKVKVSRIRRLPGGYDEVRRLRDRVRVARLARRDGTAHVIFVDSVEMVESARDDRRVSGMHWRYRGILRGDRLPRDREYLLVARDAPATTLAHEIGHAFGLGHSRATDNLMCGCRRGVGLRFTQVQGWKMRSGARRFLARASG